MIVSLQAETYKYSMNLDVYSMQEHARLESESSQRMYASEENSLFVSLSCGAVAVI